MNEPRSSGERTGVMPKRIPCQGYRRCGMRVGGCVRPFGMTAQRSVVSKEEVWKTSPEGVIVAYLLAACRCTYS